MPYLLARLLLILTCLWSSFAWAASPLPAGTLLLTDSNPSFEVSTDIQSWVERGTQETIQSVYESPKNFSTISALQRHPLTERDTLWLKLLLVRPVGNTSPWVLNIPLPFLDLVTLYQRDAKGAWSVQTAGDTLPQRLWSKRGPYSEFDLRLPAGEPQEVYVRIRNFKHISIPLRLSTASEREYQRLREIVVLALLLGALLALCTLSLIRFFEHRNPTDLRAASYSALIILAVAQINGVLNVFVWATLPAWGDYAFAVIPIIAVGAALLFVRDLYALTTQYHRHDRLLTAIGWATIASSLCFTVLDRTAADVVTTVILITATTAGMAATGLSWHGRSPIWNWLLLAYLPQYAGFLRLMAEALGLAPTMWEMRYFTTTSVALSVPFLVYALARATHDRKELVVRANHLPTQDALTGLLTSAVFQTQLEAAYERTIAHREPIALVLVKVINHEHIRTTLGDPIAEESLLRCVVKLHRILRDVDPAGRVGTASFALLLDGVATRQALNERMVQLIASGLIPLPGLEPPVTLQFHAAGVLLHEDPIAPDVALSKLNELLSSMSPHTRRPIRFLEPVATQAGEFPQESRPD